MIPNLSWPGIPNPLNITAEDHAAHTQKPGIHRPEDLGHDGKKHKGALMKAMRKAMKPRQRALKSRKKWNE